jgi:hypothetical protein
MTALLGVGCSRAGFCQLVKLNHPTVTVWGMEPGPEAAAEALPRADRVIVGFSLMASPTRHRGSMILFSDVREHI